MEKVSHSYRQVLYRTHPRRPQTLNDIRVVENAPHIMFGAGLVAEAFLNLLEPLGEQVFIDVTDGFDVDVRNFPEASDVASALTSDPDHGDVHSVVCAKNTSWQDGGQGAADHDTGGGAFEEFPSCDTFFFRSHFLPRFRVDGMDIHDAAYVGAGLMDGNA